MGGLSDLLGQGKLWRDVEGKDFIQDQMTDSTGGRRERNKRGRGGEEAIGFAHGTYDKNQNTVPRAGSGVKRRDVCVPVRQGSCIVWDHPTHHIRSSSYLSSFRVAGLSSETST